MGFSVHESFWILLYSIHQLFTGGMLSQMDFTFWFNWQNPHKYTFFQHICCSKKHQSKQQRHTKEIPSFLFALLLEQRLWSSSSVVVLLNWPPYECVNVPWQRYHIPLLKWPYLKYRHFISTEHLPAIWGCQKCVTQQTVRPISSPRKVLFKVKS